MSPFRNEKTASFKVNNQKQYWYDFGVGQGGDVIDLVKFYLASHNENAETTDALRWMRNMTGFIPSIRLVVDEDEPAPDKTLILRKAVEINQKALLDYGASRGIPASVLKRYFKQAILFNNKTGKTFYSLCMRNDWRGYELRNAYFKGCIGKKYITFIRGTVPKPPGVNIFEGAFDFATVISQQEGKPLKDDSIILHSLSNMKKATAYIKNYGYEFAYTWMDNDRPGLDATKAWKEFCKTESKLVHMPMNEFYLPHKDVNAAHIAKLEL